jgi:hypothetical protein
MQVLLAGLPEERDFLTFFRSKGCMAKVKRVTIALVVDRRPTIEPAIGTG